MMKHIGKHDQRKAVLLFKEVPGEDDMCLIVYTDLLPKLVHDPLMKCLESDVGQNSNDITGPLSRTLMDDGRNVLNVIHGSGYIRKVPTNQMILMPNASTTIRLDELNKIMAQMAEGKDATRKMAQLDAQQGMHDPAKNLPPETIAINESLGESMKVAQGTKTTPASAAFSEEYLAGNIPLTDNGVMTDAGIAQGQLTQAVQMRADASRLIAEADTLAEEAYNLAPELKPKKATRKKAVTKDQAKRGPGRPKKNVAASEG